MAIRNLLTLVFVAITTVVCAGGQTLNKQVSFATGGKIEIINRFGRVNVVATPPVSANGVTDEQRSVTISAASESGVSDDEVDISGSGSEVSVVVKPSRSGKRIDLQIELPERSRISLETSDGAVMISGNLAAIRARTETGTVAVDVPIEDLKYELLWTESRPRFVSDFELEKVKERSGGRFSIAGKIKPKPNDPETDILKDASRDTQGSAEPDGPEKRRSKERDSRHVELDLTTARGIILINVPPNEVSSDLRERPLTSAAKAIIRSGDTLLMDAIRRASPKYFGDYASTLPPLRREPRFTERSAGNGIPSGSIKRALVSVFDAKNRAITDLKLDDFEVTENTQQRDVISIEPVTAPFNLVLLLDVSGSVENYLNFIRKAARSFINTVGRDDRVAIVTFNEDVKVLSGFSTNKAILSESLDTFDAGGGTAYYDALAFTLADTLRPLKGERTAVVVLTDGDDNRSFLSFDALRGSIQESGALIYPLYVPSTLVAASANTHSGSAIDPLRTRYMSLSTKAEGEGAKLAEISGGVYYPISQLSQIQAAYDDIIVQLRTAYTVTYRSRIDDAKGKRVSPRLKMKVKRDNAFVKVVSVAAVSR